MVCKEDIALALLDIFPSAVDKSLVRLVTELLKDVMSPSFAVICVCKPDIADATVDEELYPVRVASSAVMSEFIVVMSPSLAVIWVCNPEMADATVDDEL